MTAGTGTAQLGGSVLFYRRPEPLNSERHRSLGVKQIEKPFAFMAGANAVPVTVSEFGVACAHFPLIFVGEDKTPIAVMGARAGENAFLGLDGQPDEDVYVPAFVRRYPFVFATDNAADRLLLCIDRDASMISDTPDVPFFNGDQPSKFTEEAMEFCKEFERQRRSTEQFIKILNDNNLFEVKTVSFTNRNADGSDGTTQKIADYWAVSEERLQNLPHDKFIALRDQGALGAIYAHLVSLLNWPRIIQRTMRMAVLKSGAN